MYIKKKCYLFSFSNIFTSFVSYSICEIETLASSFAAEVPLFSALITFVYLDLCFDLHLEEFLNIL